MALNKGESYESLVVKRIARPLMMDSTQITVTPELKPRLARGHWQDGTPAENFRFQVMASAGSIVSTANDLLKFLSANLGFADTELTPLMKEMQIVRHTGEPKFGTTAMPSFDEGIYQPPGSELLGHGGGGLGYLAFIGFDRVKRRGVIVLSNQMVVNSSVVGWTILQEMPLSQENITFLIREVVGIGMALDIDAATGDLRITRIYPKSPAGKAGVSAGLVIQEINGVSVVKKSLKECLGMIGGPEGEAVKFQLLNVESNESKTIELTRSKFITAIGEPIKPRNKSART